MTTKPHCATAAAPDARRRRLCAGLAFGAALGVGFGARTARASDASPSAPGVIDLDWHDDRRGRALPVRLYLPADAARPAPLVVFSHGIGGSRRGYRYLGSHWAAHGWASLHLQHVGSDRTLWQGNPLAVLGRLAESVSEAEAIDRVHDLRHALDRLLAGELAPRLDAGRIVVAGHSYGANTSLLAAGARVRRQGRLLDLREPRVRAAMLLSAPPFYGQGAMENVLGAIDLPSLHVTATADDIRIPGFVSGVDDRIAVFEAIGGRPKALAVFDGGSHGIFTDRSGTGGAWLNGQVKAATQALTLAFLHQVFDGDGAGLRDWPRRHTEILARFSTVGV